MGASAATRSNPADAPDSRRRCIAQTKKDDAAPELLVHHRCVHFSTCFPMPAGLLQGGGGPNAVPPPPPLRQVSRYCDSLYSVEFVMG